MTRNNAHSKPTPTASLEKQLKQQSTGSLTLIASEQRYRSLLVRYNITGPQELLEHLPPSAALSHLQ